MKFSIKKYCDQLAQSALPSGGFGIKKGREYRSDATAWAVLALYSSTDYRKIISSGRNRLADSQYRDGGVAIHSDYPDASWPTSLAVLAWLTSPKYKTHVKNAIDYLIKWNSFHDSSDPDGIFGHDIQLKGWSWTQNTHSWIEPTSLAVIAMETAGIGSNNRCDEAVRMILDRQLSTGGWNYGNTSVFGHELRPMPETTGMALTALADFVEIEKVAKSIDYLEMAVSRYRTPLTIAWGLLALSSWEKRPAVAEEIIAEVLKRQDVMGPFDTISLSQLILSYFAIEGIGGLLKGNSER